MITTVTLGALTLKCDYVNTPIPPKIVRINIPGRDGDVVQVLGTESQLVELRGILIGTAKDTDKVALEGYKGTVQAYADGVNSFDMIVEYVDIPTIGGQPNHYLFTVRGHKYEQ